MHYLVVFFLFVSFTSDGQDNYFTVNEAAARSFCDCYSDLVEVKGKISDTTSTEELTKVIEELQLIAEEIIKCREKWDKKFAGKVDIKIFARHVKETNKAVYDMAVEEGVF